jgi:hypothetical protein
LGCDNGKTVNVFKNKSNAAVGLSALDGVDLLYANSEKIDQSGHLYNVRIGYSANIRNRRSYELLLIHNSVKMQHDV